MLWIVRAEMTDYEVHFGPFSSKEEAQTFMNDYPDDEEMMEMEGIALSPPTLPNGSPNH